MKMTADKCQLCGDWKEARGYTNRLQSEEEAQTIINILVDDLGMRKVTVSFDPIRYKHRVATTFMGPRLIRVYNDPQGRNIGTLLHELSHLLATDVYEDFHLRRFIKPHGKEFKEAQKILTELWFGKGGE